MAVFARGGYRLRLRLTPRCGVATSGGGAFRLAWTVRVALPATRASGGVPPALPGSTPNAHSASFAANFSTQPIVPNGAVTSSEA